jgi:toxin ParE1/3/4
LIGYSFHPEAALELEEAAAFYEIRMLGLGKSFAAEVERTVSLIREFPDAGALVGVSRRRVSVSGFPYSIVYRHTVHTILIIAVAHQRKRPSYWRDRK